MTMHIDENDVCPRCGAFWNSNGACSNGHYPSENAVTTSLTEFISSQEGSESEVQKQGIIGRVKEWLREIYGD